MQPQFELSPGPLLKSGLGPWPDFAPTKETMSGIPEQVYLPFNQDWNELDWGHLFESDSNKCRRPKCSH